MRLALRVCPPNYGLTLKRRCSLILFEFFLLTTLAQLPPIPNVVVPPPKTNLYYMFIAWDLATNYTPPVRFHLYYGLNPSATGTLAGVTSGTNGVAAVSNLFYGTNYYFKARLFDDWNGPVAFWSWTDGKLHDYSDILQHPPVQPPLTNYLWLGATNWTGIVFTNPVPQMQFYQVFTGAVLAFNKLSGQWLKIGAISTTNTPLYLEITQTNNQIPYGKYQHRQ